MWRNIFPNISVEFHDLDFRKTSGIDADSFGRGYETILKNNHEFHPVSLQGGSEHE
jgi:hypothetical protein